MHPARIQAELKVRGTSQVKIAMQCGVSESAVSQVIHGHSHSKRVEHRIALTLDASLAELWPQWYGPNAPRRRKPVSMAQKLARMSEAFATPKPL